MAKSVSVCIVVVLVLFASGCDKNKPSPSNFKAVLQKYYDTHEFCTDQDITLSKDGMLQDVTTNRGIHIWISALIKDGYLASTTGGYSGKAVYSIPADKASEWIVNEDSGTGWYYKKIRPCYGYAQVLNVDNYTEPSQGIGGQSLSVVEYRYQLPKVASWAKDPEVQKALLNSSSLEDLDNETKAIQQGKMNLVLTHNGWMPQ
jgi:hypothetical protein